MMKRKLQDIGWHKECLNMRHEHLTRLLNERDRMNEMISAFSDEYVYLRRQVTQAEAEGLREFDPDTYRLKEEAN